LASDLALAVLVRVASVVRAPEGLAVPEALRLLLPRRLAHSVPAMPEAEAVVSSIRRPKKAR
jgi:hypothetical protein